MKRKKKYPGIEEGEWVYPKMKGYNFACCDCGLVHTLEFDVIVIGKTDKKTDTGLDLIAVVPINTPYPEASLGIRMRAHRNNRRTGQLRRYRYKEVKKT